MEDLKHSGLGISTFILGLVASVGLIGTVLAAGFAAASNYGFLDPNSTQAITIGLLMFLFIAIALVAIGIGIAALIQKGFKKVLPILGVTFASVMALITLGLMFIGQNAGY